LPSAIVGNKAIKFEWLSAAKTGKQQQGIKYAEVVNNDGDHGTIEQNGKVALRKGYHRIRVIYFDSGGNSLKVMMQSEKGIKKELSSTLYYAE